MSHEEEQDARTIRLGLVRLKLRIAEQPVDVIECLTDKPTRDVATERLQKLLECSEFHARYVLMSQLSDLLEDSVERLQEEAAELESALEA